MGRKITRNLKGMTLEQLRAYRREATRKYRSAERKPKFVRGSVNIKGMTDEERREYFRKRASANNARKTKPIPDRTACEKLFRECRGCHTVHLRHIDFFYVSGPGRKKKVLLNSFCKKCSVRMSAAWVRKRKFGLTPEQYAELTTGTPCQICGAVGRRVIDHCHKTGRVRGVLCRHCNSGLGHFRDRPELLEAGAAYLRASLGAARWKPSTWAALRAIVGQS